MFVKFSSLRQPTHKTYQKVSIITQIWHWAECYLTKISNPLYLISVPNMDTITAFFTEMSQHSTIINILPKLLKIGIEPHYILLASAVPGTWSWYQICRKNSKRSWRNLRGWTDGWTDWWTKPMSIFHDSAIRSSK